MSPPDEAPTERAPSVWTRASEAGRERLFFGAIQEARQLRRALQAEEEHRRALQERLAERERFVWRLTEQLDETRALLERSRRGVAYALRILEETGATAGPVEFPLLSEGTTDLFEAIEAEMSEDRST